MSQTEHAGHDRPVLGILAKTADEGTVNLEEVHREPAQIQQGRVAGAEVVDAEAHAELLERLQHAAAGTDIFHQHRFGDLETEQAGLEAGVVESREDEPGEVDRAHLAGREVHGDA